jgi:hypothetical protein
MGAPNQLFLSARFARRYKALPTGLDSNIVAAFVRQKKFNEAKIKSNSKEGTSAHPLNHQLTNFHRAMWAILTKRHDLAMVFLNSSRRSDGPQMAMALAMLMSNTYRGLAEINVTYVDTLQKQKERVDAAIQEVSREARATRQGGRGVQGGVRGTWGVYGWSPPRQAGRGSSSSSDTLRARFARARDFSRFCHSRAPRLPAARLFVSLRDY